jgi:hypothetical protein
MISIQGTYSSYNIHNSDISIDMSSSLQSSSANNAIVKSKVSQRQQKQLLKVAPALPRLGISFSAVVSSVGCTAFAR